MIVKVHIKDVDQYVTRSACLCLEINQEMEQAGKKKPSLYLSHQTETNVPEYNA